MTHLLDARLQYEKVMTKLDSDGFVLLEGSLSGSKVDSLISVIDKADRWYEESPGFHGSNAYLVPNIINKSETTLDLCFADEFVRLANIFFKPGAHEQETFPFQVHLMHARVLFGKTSAQELHIDTRCCGVHPPSHLHFFIYLDDCLQPGDGASTFVPGSHKEKRYSLPSDIERAVPVLAPRGSIIILNSATFHGSTEKVTDGKRRLITLAYSRWFIRQPFSIPYFSSWPRELTENERRLLGFENFGAVDDMTRISARGPLPKLHPK